MAGQNKKTMSPLERQKFLASGNLIPISRAAKFTPYSAEYLSLLARKGKLKAVKISRDWLTTSVAVKEYVEKQKNRHYDELKILHAAERGER